MSSIIFLMVLGILAITSCTKAASENPSEAASVSEEKQEEKASEPSAPVQNPQGKGRVYMDLFDTVSYIYSYAGDSDEEHLENSVEVHKILSEYHKLFDIYYEYSDVNNIRTINLNAGIAPVAVDRKLLEFLKYAKALYELTGGEMNIMMGSVLSIWHEARYADKPYLPAMEDLVSASALTSFDYLVLDEENGTAFITVPGASLDVGALGKGYATEMAARYLEAKGVTSYVLNIGGNIRIIGTKVDGSDWTTGIRNPKDPDGAFALKVAISNVSCVTSGNYERYFTVGGVRYSHIIDKDTLMPATYFDSVSVIARDSGLSDALSTALYCMSYEEGLELVNCLDGVECIWIFPSGEIRYTDGLKDRIIGQ